MAYTTINKSTDYFNPKLYTGNGAAGHSITGVGHQPDFTWIKQRDSRDHFLFNSVSGATKYLASNTTALEDTDVNTLTAFGSDGFTLGSGVGVNENNDTHVSWNWKAGTTSGITTTGATTTPTAYSFNQTAGFSIIKYTGAGSQRKVAHGLGAVPALIIIKKTSGSGDYWAVKHQDYTTNSYYQYLNDTIAQTNAADNFTNIAPTDVFFYVETDGPTNTSGATYIAYCFAEKTGYSKFGSYIGNGRADGAFNYTGFAPSFVMVKKTSGTGSWWMRDNKIAPYNLRSQVLVANSSGAETNGVADMDFYSNGFKMRDSSDGGNGSGGSYIYMAFGQSLVGSNNVPNNAR